MKLTVTIQQVKGFTRAEKPGEIVVELEKRRVLELEKRLVLWAAFAVYITVKKAEKFFAVSTHRLAAPSSIARYCAAHNLSKVKSFFAPKQLIV